ncbi:GGDEF domain-containing protein [Peterkaempfera bronchialis]|uniref:GGDEF domain-containing protein n=1 Tax=Peterkaempfera bronchialis TaxID=2126346 RepID=A0A345SZF8_9ACTN|nr:GGDEF domain-containing protein [Peterkaempfera bronchialis]AXI79113.1 GGDEF domain-containing protein [Peterkaempfera bronchialis]
MSTAVLVRTLAVLSLPACAATVALALLTQRLRRRHRAATARAAELDQRVRRLESDRAALERTAVTDPLTGVWNYRHLQLTLDREVARHTRGNRPLALLLIGVGGFQAINEAHGHPRGHAALRDLAQRLALEIRRSDTLGRYGGEEFLVLLPDTGVEGAVQVAERLCWTVRRHRLPLPEDAARPGPTTSGLTAAIGIAVLPGDGEHATTLLRAAGRALGDARRAGGDCWRGLPADREAAAADGQTHLIDSAHVHMGVSAAQ